MQNKKEIKDFRLGQSFIKGEISHEKNKFFFVKYSIVDIMKFVLLVCEYR